MTEEDVGCIGDCISDDIIGAHWSGIMVEGGGVVVILVGNTFPSSDMRFVLWLELIFVSGC